MSSRESRAVLAALETALDSGALDEAIAAVRPHIQSEVADTAFCYLLRRQQHYRESLNTAVENQGALQELLEKMTRPPWFPARLLALTPSEAGCRATVLHGSQRREVVIGEGVDAQRLVPGDEVFLNTELNAVVDVCPENGLGSVGEIASFDRYGSDGRLILRRRDEEVVVTQCGRLQGIELSKGDLVRWDTSAWMALERIDSPRGQQYFLTAPPDAGLHQIGGNREQVSRLMQALSLTADPELAFQYGLHGAQVTILLVGPPGCGKTLMARAVAGELGRRMGREVVFAVVKPAEWLSPYVGETERNIRECFQALRAEARTKLVILFLDEIEAIGRSRGAMGSQHADRFIACMLAEIQGFDAEREETGGSFAVIAACNRKDLLDTALWERISSLELYVGRPDARAARAILDIHLPSTVPFSPNGAKAQDTRADIIETIVSRFYAPNGDNEICKIQFADRSVRTVVARDLVSGRILEQLCRSARMRAYCRHLEQGQPGVEMHDVLDSVEDSLERLRTSLTVRNAALHLDDIPDDVQVVSVEPVRSPAAREHNYLNIA